MSSNRSFVNGVPFMEVTLPALPVPMALCSPPPLFSHLFEPAILVQDGSQATWPHWAKWSEAYVSDADLKLKQAYADRLPLLQAVAKEFDPTGVFVNNYFAKLFAP